MNTEAIDCLTCKKAVIAEFEPTNGLTTLYDYDPYIKNMRIPHQHPADSITIRRIEERVAAEKRLLDDPDNGDWVYILNESQMESHI